MVVFSARSLSSSLLGLFCLSLSVKSSDGKSNLRASSVGNSSANRLLQEDPLLLAQFWQSGDPNQGSYSAEKNAQRLNLAIFYYSTGGDEWVDNTDWLSYTVDECDWFSRSTSTCDIDGFYRELDLNENGLSGSLPSEIGNLSRLRLIGLSENRILGNIPGAIGALSNSLEYFDLTENNLSGSIPNEVSQLSNVDLFAVSSNFLEGEIAALTGLSR